MARIGGHKVFPEIIGPLRVTVIKVDNYTVSELALQFIPIRCMIS